MSCKVYDKVWQRHWFNGLSHCIRCGESKKTHSEYTAYWDKNNPVKAKENNRKCQERWRKKNPLKEKAHAEVKKALRSGLIRKKRCHVCDTQFTEAHHRDYNYPLDVVWLCKKHHWERHC